MAFIRMYGVMANLGQCWLWLLGVPLRYRRRRKRRKEREREEPGDIEGRRKRERRRGDREGRCTPPQDTKEGSCTVELNLFCLYMVHSCSQSVFNTRKE